MPRKSQLTDELIIRATLLVAVALVACGKPTDQSPERSKPVEPARPAHPAIDAETSASPQKGEGPAVAVADRVDGLALRAKHRERLAKDVSAVTVLTGGTPAELGARICEAAVPRRPPDTPILIKPNMSGFNWFHDPRTHNGDDGVKGRITDPEFVRGAIQCLKRRGHTKITIADGFTGKASDWQRLLKVSGYGAMAKEEGVALVAMDDDGVFDKEGDMPGKPLGISGIERTHVPTLLVPKVMSEHLQHGMVISVPKLKAHRFAVFSLGIKAMQGTAMYSDATPAYQQKWRSHREIDKALALVKKGDPTARAVYVKALEVFAERMVDMLELEAPDVELVEGAPAMSGDGFDTLLPIADNVAIGGTNVVMVDRVGAQFLGLWDSDALAKELGGHRTSPLLEVAARRFGIDVSKPELTGDGASLLATRRPAHLIAMAGFDIDDADAGAHEHADNAAAQPKELHALKVEGAPAIDGVADEVWTHATPVTFATDWSGKPTTTPTTVRALWSSKGLYLLWELDNTLANTDTSRPIDTERIDLYEENCVELFLAPDPAQRRRYFEIELGPFGHFFDVLVDRTGKARSDNAWSAGMRIGTHRDDAAHRAVIEVAIEGPDVVAALKAGAQLPLGLYRMEGKGPRQYLAAFPTRTPKPNFHVPDAFGRLELDE
jgi:uncharacterized protein (DUF362 family)